MLLKAGWLVLSDMLGAVSLVRTPEPTAEMADPDQVRAFHAQGERTGVLQGVYHFNARVVHALTPKSGTVVDLGCGSGQFLRYLAKARPDLHLIGIDLSSAMIEAGRDMLLREGIAERVDLRIGDMTRFVDSLPRRIDTLTSVFALHHLPSFSLLEACLGEVAAMRGRDGCAVWLFDHARPRRRETAIAFPKVFTPDASSVFNTDSRNSLMAAWSFQEISAALEHALGASARGRLPRVLPLYQAHWMWAQDQSGSTCTWQAGVLPEQAEREARGLFGIFRGCPGNGRG